MARAIDWAQYDQLKAEGLADRKIARRWGITRATFQWRQDMGHTYAELRRMSVDDLVQEYDRKAKNVDLTVELCRQEIARRELEEHSQRMLTMTETMRQMTADIRRWTGVVMGLTIVMAILTAINVILLIWTRFRP